ncbi:MAG: ABC transporter ATP-binding protein [Lonepinella koalarum]|nr:ABC transporter ATP-binding protein [Lonepinella koalarum]
MAKLEIKNVTKKFGQFYAAKSISFVAEEGEFVTLLGPSGCGKTSLLKLIAGFHSVDEGEILIGGKNVNGVPPEKRNTAMCFQSYALFPHLNVSHNICYGLQQRKIDMNEQKARLDVSIKQMDLEMHRLKLPSQLSGGQQQRVALARAMVTRPDVILFDEPLSNLDAKLRESVRFEIKQLSKQYNLTSIYVTHDQAEALAMSDKIIVLNKGEIEQIGTPHEIYNAPLNRFVADFIGVANIAEAHISETGENTYSVQSVFGDFIAYSHKKPLSSHSYICFRPENATLVSKDSDAPNKLTVKVLQTAFMGNLTEIQGEVSTNGQQKIIRLQLTKFPQINEDNTLTFSIAPESICFLEAVDEKS